MEEGFGGTETAPHMTEDQEDIISAYTDDDALEDGFVVDVTLFCSVTFHGLPVNRMTNHLFMDLKPFVESCAPEYEGDFGKALASILKAKCSFAQGDPGNNGQVGDIYKLPPNLWLVRNEVGGWTAMFPEDY